MTCPLQPIALKLGLNLASKLWKDKAMTELNVAIIHSYQVRNVVEGEEGITFLAPYVHYSTFIQKYCAHRNAMCLLLITTQPQRVL